MAVLGFKAPSPPLLPASRKLTRTIMLGLTPLAANPSSAPQQPCPAPASSLIPIRAGCRPREAMPGKACRCVPGHADPDQDHCHAPGPPRTPALTMFTALTPGLPPTMFVASMAGSGHSPRPPPGSAPTKGTHATHTTSPPEQCHHYWAWTYRQPTRPGAAPNIGIASHSTTAPPGSALGAQSAIHQPTCHARAPTIGTTFPHRLPRPDSAPTT